MRWTWDQRKNDTNKRNHGLSFETALLVFDDPLAATRDDPYPTEQRWRTIGDVGGLVLIVAAEIRALEDTPDEQIDTSDIPEVLDWSEAKRGVFYRPVKEQITLRLDADVVAWFKQRARGGRGYQTDINHAPREHVQRCQALGTAASH